MAINKRIELTWNGESCSVLVTMEVVERIEERLNLARMAHDLATGNVKLSHTARLISILLKEGGQEVTADEVYEGIFDGDTEESARSAVVLVGEILGAVFPDVKKKSGQPKKKPKSEA